MMVQRIRKLHKPRVGGSEGWGQTDRCRLDVKARLAAVWALASTNFALKSILGPGIIASFKRWPKQL